MYFIFIKYLKLKENQFVTFTIKKKLNILIFYIQLKNKYHLKLQIFN